MRPGNFVTLPNQPVDTKGFISIPYAGLVPAAGKTPAQVEKEIVDRIKNRAIEPQAVVALVTANSSLITVIGEINSTFTSSPTGRLPAQPVGRTDRRRDHQGRRFERPDARPVGGAGAAGSSLLCSVRLAYL